MGERPQRSEISPRYPSGWKGKASFGTSLDVFFVIPPLACGRGEGIFFSSPGYSFCLSLAPLQVGILLFAILFLLFPCQCNNESQRKGHPPMPRKPVYTSSAVGFKSTKAENFSNGSLWPASRTLLLHRGISGSLESQEDSFLMGIHPWGQLRAQTYSRLLPAYVGVSTYSKIYNLLEHDSMYVPYSSVPCLLGQWSSAVFQTQPTPFLLSDHNNFSLFGTNIKSL